MKAGRQGARLILVSGPRDLLTENPQRYDLLTKVVREDLGYENVINLGAGESVIDSRIKDLSEQDQLGESSLLVADLLAKESEEVYQDIHDWCSFKRQVIIVAKSAPSPGFRPHYNILHRARLDEATAPTPTEMIHLIPLSPWEFRVLETEGEFNCKVVTLIKRTIGRILVSLDPEYLERQQA